MLLELRSTAAVARGKVESQASPGAMSISPRPLTAAIDQVNQVQQQAHQMTENFAASQTDVNLQDVAVNLRRPVCPFSRWCKCATSW